MNISRLVKFDRSVTILNRLVVTPLRKKKDRSEQVKISSVSKCSYYLSVVCLVALERCCGTRHLCILPWVCLMCVMVPCVVWMFVCMVIALYIRRSESLFWYRLVVTPFRKKWSTRTRVGITMYVTTGDLTFFSCIVYLMEYILPSSHINCHSNGCI